MCSIQIESGSLTNSPYAVGGKVLVASEDGDLFFFKHEKTHEVLDEVAAWLGLSAVAVTEHGDLATALARARGGRRGVTVVG